MIIITVKNNNKIVSEICLSKTEAEASFEGHLINYAGEKNLNLDAGEIKNFIKSRMYEHEEFGIYISEPDTDYTLIEDMNDTDIAQYLETEGDVSLVAMHLSDDTINKIVEDNEGGTYYLLRFNNLLQEMEAKKITENFGK